MTNATPRLNRMRFPRSVGIALVVLAVLSTAGLVVGSIREHERISCQAAVNDQLAHAIQQRSDAAQAATRQEVTVVGEITDPKATPQSRLAVLAAWRDSLAKQLNAQSANPLPSGSTCG